VTDWRAALPPDIAELTISEAQTAMSQGRLTARGLTLAYLDRIARYDHCGPALNSILELNPDALHLAAAMDHELSCQGPRGPLHGIPVILKDNIDTADKMHTSAGSAALAGSYAAQDSAVAAALRRAGAVILGKANMTEWANFMTQGMPAGYSSRGGQVQNPYGPGRLSPGGSSSGSGVAVAANLTMVAIGTETSGSILSPAGNNSVVGIKPTVGLVSRSGIIPIMHTQDTAGPLARTVRDAALLLGAIAGQDEHDPATWLARQRAHDDYSRFCDGAALAGCRLGVPRELLSGVEPGPLAVFDEAVRQAQALGAVIVDPVDLPCAGEPYDNQAMVHEFKPNLNRYLSRLAPEVAVHSLHELIEYNSRHPRAMLKYGQTLLIEAETKSGNLTEPAYLASLASGIHQSTVHGIDHALAAERLDALLVPSNSGARVAARAGYPSVTVPAGYAPDGLPVGLTFTGLAWSEPRLIALAYSFEQATKLRRPPVF